MFRSGPRHGRVGFQAAVGALAGGVLLSNGGGSAREIELRSRGGGAQGWRADDRPPVVDHVWPIVEGPCHASCGMLVIMPASVPLPSMRNISTDGMCWQMNSASLSSYS